MSVEQYLQWAAFYSYRRAEEEKAIKLARKGR
jgi:hypothetical protein